MSEIISTYHRLIRTAQAEQTLREAKIKVSLDVLRPHILGQVKNEDIYRYMKVASQNSGYISTEYDAKTKLTARLFTKRGHLNLITLSDKRILKAFVSRYGKGKLLCIDYASFEPTIIKSVLDLDFEGDFHTHTANLSGLDRDVIKALNMKILYSEDENYVADLLIKHIDTDYYEFMINIKKLINDFIYSSKELYESKGFVVNSYGRKIYPKSVSAIFNNVIQSIGSEILIEAIIELGELLKDKEAHLLFHRFDALYFDMSHAAIYKHLREIIKIMESVDDSIELKVGISIGKELTSLKEL